jgi:hypothetical protein
LALTHDEQLVKLEANIQKNEKKNTEYEKEIRQLKSEAETANVYMMGFDTKKSNTRMCPVESCNGQGSTKKGTTHYT